MGEPETYRLIVYSNPSDSKLHENRRFVRSHVTKRQHRSMKAQSATAAAANPNGTVRARRRNVTTPAAIQRAAAQALDDGSLPVFIASTQENQSPVESCNPPPPAPNSGLLSPLSIPNARAGWLDDAASIDAASIMSSFQSRSGSVSSHCPDHMAQQLLSPLSYTTTPPPELHDPCEAQRIPRHHLPYIPASNDDQAAYDAASLLLRATDNLTSEYELMLEALACAKIYDALRRPTTSELLLRAIAHMAHYDQLTAQRMRPGMFHHHMQCLAERVARVGGLHALPHDLQAYIAQIDCAVAGFRGTQRYFGTPLPYGMVAHLPSPQ